MKVCGGCGEQYSQRVDFCFHDGEILVSVDSTGDSPDVDPRVDVLSLSRDLPPPVEILRQAEPSLATAESVPLADRSRLGSAGTILVVVALLVPLIGGGLLTYSMVVRGEW